MEISRLQMEITGLQVQVSNYRVQLSERQRQVDIIQNQLEYTQKQMITIRSGLDEKQSQISNLGNLFTELKLENDEIKTLKRDLRYVQESILSEKLKSKEEKLESLVRQLGVDSEQVRNLRNAYKQLIEARRDINQNNINVANNNINNIRTALGVNLENIQKLCRNCEKMAILRIELDQIYQERYQSQQEVPPR